MSDTFPIYRKSKSSKAVVKFIDRIEGYVIHPGTTNFKTGSLHYDWRPYYENCWEPYEYTDSTAIPTKTPDQLELFESTSISSSATITKVPNGYVMTSRSGHQLFIKDLSKDSL